MCHRRVPGSRHAAEILRRGRNETKVHEGVRVGWRPQIFFSVLFGSLLAAALACAEGSGQGAMHAFINGSADAAAATAPLLKEHAVIETPQLAHAASDAEEAAPVLPPWRILLLFLWFGARAFGGPMAQINLMHSELVDQQKWVSHRRYLSVFKTYQVLPGPEATELACYFGSLSGGMLGGLMGGLGFITPGFVLMLLFAYLYTTFGTSNGIFQAVFAGLQPAVCAMVFRSAHKIGDATCRHQSSNAIDWRLFLIVVLAAFESLLAVNFFVIKGHLTVLYLLLLRVDVPGLGVPAPADGAARTGTLAGPQLRAGWAFAAALWALAPIAAFIAIIIKLGPFNELVPQVRSARRGRRMLDSP